MSLPLIIDNFAGGGGASTGIEAAMRRPADIAINHDQSAIAVHSANHPHTRHYCQSIYSVDPLEATGGEPVLLAWFSPDCKHHSKAKGGKPREKYIRDMAHVVPHWIERLASTPSQRGKPQVIMLENVEEFRQWGPLDEHGKPIAERKGEEFDLWVRRIRKAGYKVEWRELRACDYGTPTTRKRLFLIARCDGLPIVWPEQTHAAPTDPRVIAGELLPWRTAAECIDWSLACPSIFDRKQPLKPATCRRIAAGVMRHVVNSAQPFIVGTVSQDSAPTAASLIKLRKHSEAEDPQAPLGTICAGGLHHGVTAATLIMMGYGERNGQAPRVPGLDSPARTIVAGGGKHGLVSAFLAQHNTERGERSNPGRAADKPISTITGRGTQQQAVEVTMVEAGTLPTDLLHRAELVAGFLIKYYGTAEGGHDCAAPLGTVTTRERFAVITVTIANEAGGTDSFVLVDIGMRMLTPRELANAQGFPPEYVLDPECWYKTDGGNMKFGRLPKSHQIARIGNAVCPPMSEALCRANLSHAIDAQQVAA